ncbi:hypothetical protein EDC01DRAFT_783773 [Geopyxis carbonaria]|nr:hypothetical protein EDC01DRAFT_783773 [Geopyxis carbonaria]
MPGLRTLFRRLLRRGRNNGGPTPAPPAAPIIARPILTAPPLPAPVLPALDLPARLFSDDVLEEVNKTVDPKLASGAGPAVEVAPTPRIFDNLHLSDEYLRRIELAGRQSSEAAAAVMAANAQVARAANAQTQARLMAAGASRALHQAAAERARAAAERDVLEQQRRAVTVAEAQTRSFAATLLCAERSLQAEKDALVAAALEVEAQKAAIRAAAVDLAEEKVALAAAAKKVADDQKAADAALEEAARRVEASKALEALNKENLAGWEAEIKDNWRVWEAYAVTLEKDYKERKHDLLGQEASIKAAKDELEKEKRKFLVEEGRVAANLRDYKKEIREDMGRKKRPTGSKLPVGPNRKKPLH